MADRDRAAQHYAAALAELAAASGRTVPIEQDLSRLVETVRAQPGLAARLAAPALSAEGRAAAIRELFACRIDPLLVHFAALLAGEGEWAAIPDIAGRYFGLKSDRDGRSDGELVAARPITDRQVDEITRMVSTQLGRPVRLRVSVDPALIGGFTVRVGDFVFDGSVDRQLEFARARLLGLTPDRP